VTNLQYLRLLVICPAALASTGSCVVSISFCAFIPQHHVCHVIISHKMTAYHIMTRCCQVTMTNVSCLLIMLFCNRIDSPLWYDQDQMLELAGTTLAAAAAAQQMAVARSWQRLRPAAVNMLQQVFY
jgi:hypothetical protein